MNVLLIDTSTNIEIVTVKAHDQYCDRTSRVEISHSVTLFDRIDAALKGAGIGIHEIELIGVGTGPGSFTGVRIAVSSARMLAQVLQMPLVGIDTTLVWALSIDATPGGAILVAFDAKKGRVFGALYRKTDTADRAVMVPPGDYAIQDILSAFDGNGMLTCVGQGIERFEKEIQEIAPGSAITPHFIPSGMPACKHVQKLFESEPDKYRNFNAVLPRYARKSDAEIILEAKKKTV